MDNAAVTRCCMTRRQAGASATRDEVLASAARGQVAAAELALLTRAVKDVALLAMADALLDRRAGDPGRERSRRRRPLLPPAPRTRWWTGCG